MLLCSLCFASLFARAQYVNIPDAAFGDWLNNNGYAGCMTGNSSTGWQLNISCSQVVNATYLNISYTGISDFDGLQYFTNVRSLDISSNYYATSLPSLPPLLTYLAAGGCDLNSLPTLPATLTYLDINNNNNLFSLPALNNQLQELHCQNCHISSLPDPLPDSLRILYCGSNDITFIGSLPPYLIYLDCSYNNWLQSLPTLPVTLTDLYCSYTGIATLPAIPNSTTWVVTDGSPLTSIGTLGSGLIHLEVTGSQLTTLPALPASLQELDCSASHIASLPALPAGLTYLRTVQNPLTSLPALPASLQELRCDFDSLHTLPTLPASLTTLSIMDCHFASLPALPAQLSTLDCSGNQITALPVLPASLSSLLCGGNQLTSLPVLPPALSTLDCRANFISFIPNIPATLTYLDIVYNYGLHCLPRISQTHFNVFNWQGSVSCLPSRFSATSYDTNPATAPLCTPATGCEFYYNIAGTVHYDSSATCLDDSLIPGAPITGMKVQLRQGSTVLQQFYTFNSGGYSFKTPALGSYTVDIDTTALPLAVVCPQSFSRPVLLTPTDSVKHYEGFGLQCAGVDFGLISMQGARFRPTFSSRVGPTGGNIALQRYSVDCGAGVSGTVTTTWTGAASYSGPAPGALTPTSVSGHTLTYTVADLNALQRGDLDIILTTDVTAPVGSYVCITSTLSPSVPDSRPADNTMTECYTIVQSYDPNYKEVTPTAILPGATDWLTYTIHFQNTGSDTAYLVVLKDTLSQYVDAASFQYLASSHHAVIQLEGSAMTFTFPHINLVDSATNPPLSEGWIQYRVRANGNLPNGTAINNTAYIYFDLNPAVVTNTATTTVQLTATCVDGDIRDSITICQGDTLYYGGMIMTSTGFYYNVMQNATGCDTTYRIWLTVLPPSHLTISDTICAGDSVTFAGQVLTANGTYTDTLTGAGGCDSIISLVLTVRPLSYLVIYDTICSGEVYVYLHDTLTTSDSSIYIFQNAYGCDSIVLLVLTVRPAPPVGFELHTLAENRDIYAVGAGDTIWCQSFRPTFAMKGGYPAGGHYSGLYIANDTFSIPHPYGYLEYEFTTDTMSYTVTDSNGCSNTATRYMRLDFCEGINDLSALSTIHIYPDPNTGTFTLQTERSYGLSYRISDILGKEILQGTITADQQPVRLPDIADGVYTITVDGARPLRFVVVR